MNAAARVFAERKWRHERGAVDRAGGVVTLEGGKDGRRELRLSYLPNTVTAANSAFQPSDKFKRPLQPEVRMVAPVQAEALATHVAVGKSAWGSAERRTAGIMWTLVAAVLIVDLYETFGHSLGFR